MGLIAGVCRYIIRVGLLAAFIVTPQSAPVTIAQSATATLSGTVVDENDALISNVGITVTNIETGLQRQTTTTSSGYFVAPHLLPGRYNVTASRQGFAKLEVRNVILNLNDQRPLNLQMKVGEIAELITVEGSSLIQAESAAVGTVIDRQFVENLPLNGRSFTTLLELTPGAVLTKTPGQFSVNGQRTNANYFTVDGVSANVAIDPFIQIAQTAGGSLPAFSALGTTSNLVTIDALQELNIQGSTYSPEFGRLPGAQVAAVTRSGTNEFHGTVFEYFRNDVLDANDWFANSRGLNKPALRQNNFGGVLGGPILRDRTFFFFSYEGLRLRQPQVGITAVPARSARAVSPSQIQPFLNAFPFPNGGDLGNGLEEFSAGYSNPSRLDATSIRVDHSFGHRFTLYGRYNRAPSEAAQRGGTFDTPVSLNSSTQLLFQTDTVTIGAIQVLGSRATNDIRANYSRNSGSNIYSIDSFGGAVPLNDEAIFPPFASSQDSLFGFSLSDQVVFFVGRNAKNYQRQINVVDNLALAKNNHQFKFGVDFRHLTPILDTSLYFQQASFRGVSGALTGIAAGVQVSGKSGKATTTVNNFSAYAQDTWRVGNRFTFTYGVRWEYNPPASITADNPPLLATGIENPPTIHLAPPGSSWTTSSSNLAPRFGIAYQLSDKPGQELVARGGFGIFYDTAGGMAGSVLGGTNSSATLIFNAPFPLSSTQATPLPPSNPIPPYSLMTAFESDLSLPRTYQWNAALEQSLSLKQTVTAAYVGAAGRNLLRRERYFRPNSEFINVNAFTDAATSDYHALQVQYQRRLSHGLQSLASYSWSHSIDISSNESSLTLPGATVDPRFDRASSDFDVRHSFSAGLTYDIPKTLPHGFLDRLIRNWSLDALFRARTATPVNILTGTRLFGVFNVLRPDLISGVPQYLQDPTVAGGRRINATAFSTPPPNRQGNLGRNALRGFSATQLDMGVHRRFTLSERLAVQFRAEFFNILNHPNFADPESNLSVPGLFGRSTMMLGRSLGGLNPLYQMGGPRSIQFAMRLQF